MFSLLLKLIKNRHSIWALAKSDLKSRYSGSILGVTWLFLLPLVNLLVMWFAFQLGFKAAPTKGVPFILWLVSGLFPWTFFSESMSSTMGSVLEKAFLVKKVVFDVELLPLIKLISSLVLFIFLIFVMLLVFLFYGFAPDIYWLQIIYYAFCVFILVLSLSWLTSAIVVFYRDLGQVIAVGLQLGFWATPIFWNAEVLPEHLKFIAVINPVNYVVTGFRNALIIKKWFWQDSTETIYFWFFIIFFSWVGMKVFRKLRPHFADVL